MTKIQLSFNLATPLDEQLMNRIADVYGTYGILRIRAEPGGLTLTVEYDATRFTPEDVEAALARAGLPLVERSV
jgi:hypothetical protein